MIFIYIILQNKVNIDMEEGDVSREDGNLCVHSLKGAYKVLSSIYFLPKFESAAITTRWINYLSLN